MTAPRAKLLAHNPNAVIQTSQGWQYPDGTFKAFYTRQVPVQPIQRPSIWRRVFG